MTAAVRSFMRDRQRKPTIVKRYFTTPLLAYAA
jgi:hypothetical protein